MLRSIFLWASLFWEWRDQCSNIIPEHFEPGPARWPNPSPARARPAHEPYWTGVGKDLEAREFFFARARLEMLFLVVLHYKMCGRPAQARKSRPDASSGMVMSRIFRPEIT
jgi:hypothetical protein